MKFYRVTVSLLLAFGRAAFPASPSIDADGMIRIDGKRTFLIGLYDTPKIGDALREAKSAGFNYVRAAPTTAAVRAAAGHGLFAWTTTGTAPAKIRELVQLLGNEPALIAWEIEDEPSFVWKEPLKLRTPPEAIVEARKLIRSLDPSRLAYLNHSPTNLVTTLRRYNEGTDIVATDVYPVIPRGIRGQFALWPDGQQGDYLDESISQVGRYADKMRQVAGSSRPVFMVLQGFAWETLQKQPDPRMILYPTREQTRFMAYQAIAHGVNGIVYWGPHMGPPGNPAWQAVKETVRELKTIEAALALPGQPQSGLEIEYFDTGHSLDKGLEYIVKGDVVIVVNADKNPVDARLAKLPGACAAPRRERFTPFEARVYRCGKAGIR